MMHLVLLLLGSGSLAFGPRSHVRAAPRSRRGVARPSLGLGIAASEVSSLVASGVAVNDLSATADALAGSLFGASLLPWLAMLYWIGHRKTEAPSGVVYGLQFLLLFVFGSIPAAIGAGALFGDSLADVDWLHGSAESLLAITNCVVVLGFRDALAGKAQESADSAPQRLVVGSSVAAGLALSSALLAFAAGAPEHGAWLGDALAATGALGSEPSNALSMPTWVIHTSSLVEWLVAMGLAWRYAAESGTPQWRGVTWGMLPLHTSGIVACTYHLFYNDPALAWCIPLQAGCTLFGNATLAFACWRLAYAKGWRPSDARDDFDAALAWLIRTSEIDARDERPAPLSPRRATPIASAATSALVGWEDLGDAWATDLDLAFLAKLGALSTALAAVVKFAPVAAPQFAAAVLAGDATTTSACACAVIVVPTLLNMAKWARRSAEEAAFEGEF